MKPGGIFADLLPGCSIGDSTRSITRNEKESFIAVGILRIVILQPATTLSLGFLFDCSAKLLFPLKSRLYVGDGYGQPQFPDLLPQPFEVVGLKGL
jgi:hypothetical protein